MGYEEYKKNALLWYLYFQFSGTRFTVYCECRVFVCVLGKFLPSAIRVLDTIVLVHIHIKVQKK